MPLSSLGEWTSKGCWVAQSHWGFFKKEKNVKLGSASRWSRCQSLKMYSSLFSIIIADIFFFFSARDILHLCICRYSKTNFSQIDSVPKNPKRSLIYMFFCFVRLMSTLSTQCTNKQIPIFTPLNFSNRHCISALNPAVDKKWKRSKSTYLFPAPNLLDGEIP